MSEHYAKYEHYFGEIRKDGHTMFNEDIARDLNRKSYLEAQNKALSDEVSELKSMLIGADFLIKILYDGVDLSIGKEMQINEFQKDMKPIIDEFIKKQALNQKEAKE